MIRGGGPKTHRRTTPTLRPQLSHTHGGTLEGQWTARVVCLIWSDHTQVAPALLCPTHPTQPCIFLAALGSWPSSSISVKQSFDQKKTVHNMQRKEIFSDPPPRSCERHLSLHQIFLHLFSSSDQMQNAASDTNTSANTNTNMELIHQMALQKLTHSNMEPPLSSSLCGSKQALKSQIWFEIEAKCFFKVRLA